MVLPEKTVERLSLYRRVLLNCLKSGKNYIYSHELGNMLNYTAVQVRRDIMLIGYTSTAKKGYDINELVETIGQIIDSEKGLNVLVVGMGNFGKAITSYFIGKRSKLNLIAAVDTDNDKINKVISGLKCYALCDLNKVVADHKISIAILTVPPENARELAEKLTIAGIKGILNFTSEPLTTSPDVYLEEYDMVTSIEKVAYFVKDKLGENPNENE